MSSQLSVLGTGVTGLCVATALVEAGADVEIVVPEPRPQPASQLAGGMLAPYCETEQAPPLVRERGLAAAAWWQAHGANVTRLGTLVVAAARDLVELDRFAARCEGHQRVDPAQLEPALQQRFHQGLWFANEAHLDPRQALATLEAQLRQRGVRFHSGKPQGQVIDCRGSAARAELPSLRCVRGEMLYLQAPQVQLQRPIRLLHPRFPCYLVPRGQGRYMLGATMLESDDPGPITAAAVMELLSAAWTIHPGLAQARLLETGAGLRPAFADNLPALQLGDGRLHVNGMYRHGFLLAPALAADVVAWWQRGMHSCVSF